MARQRTLSIAEEGLKPHFDKMGLDYAEFNKRMLLKEPKAIIARAIGVSRDSVYKYVKQWHIERGDSV